MLEQLIGAVWPREASQENDISDAVSQISRRFEVTLDAPWPTEGSHWRGLAWRASGGAPVGAWRLALREALATLGADIAVTAGPLAQHPPTLVVSDVDSTFFTGEVIDDLAAHAGQEEKVAAITARAMRGELDFRQSLDERVSTLEGLDVGALDAVRAHVVLTPGARELSLRLSDLGIPLGLVSGGFTEVVTPVAADLGIDLVRANRLAHKNGRLTGELVGAVIDAQAKVDTAQQWAEQLGSTLDRVVAIGDGANDLPLLQAAGLGVAYCAKPIVVAQAPSALNFPRLDAVLGLVGLSGS